MNHTQVYMETVESFDHGKRLNDGNIIMGDNLGYSLHFRLSKHSI
jgi:hypothetical protein